MDKFSKLHSDDFCASEDSVVMHCDSCQFEGTNVEAEAFCNECNEFLCQQCAKSHVKFQAFRLHSILRGSCMPNKKEETSVKLAVKLCNDHKLNEVQFYCFEHRLVFCGLCKTAKHSACENKRIQDILNGEEDMPKFNDAASELERIKRDFERLKTSDIETIDSVKNTTEMKKRHLKSVRKKMKEILLMLEKQVTEDESQEKSHIEELRENVEIYNDAISHIACLQEDISHVLKSTDKVAVFAGASKLKRICTECEKVKNTTLTSKTRATTSEKTLEKLLKLEKACDTIHQKMDQKMPDTSKELVASVGISENHALPDSGRRNIATKDMKNVSCVENNDETSEIEENDNKAQTNATDDTSQQTQGIPTKVKKPKRKNRSRRNPRLT